MFDVTIDFGVILSVIASIETSSLGHVLKSCLEFLIHRQIVKSSKWINCFSTKNYL